MEILYSTLQEIAAFGRQILKYLFRRWLLVVYCLDLISAGLRSVRVCTEFQRNVRKVLVVDRLQRKCIGCSVGRAQPKLLTDLPPGKLLRTDHIVATARDHDIE